MSFSLTKWYFDVVTAEGDFAIAYWGEVRWGRLRPRFSALQLGSHAAGPLPWRVSAQDVGPPCAEEGIRWHAAPLDLLIEGRRDAPPIAQELLVTPQGRIDWCAELPRTAMRVHVGDRVLDGRGYVERIDLTLLPWRLPADTVRWGRFVAPDASLIWIEWQGDEERNLVFLDGARGEGARVSDTAIACADGATLTMTAPQVLTNDRVNGLLAPLEVLRSIMIPLAKLHQTRWLSHGTLERPGRPAAEGWVIHELVSW